MKKSPVMFFICSLFLFIIARDAGSSEGVYRNTGMDGGLFTEAQADTYWLASYEFDQGGTCAAQGWSSHDWTAQPGTMFHVDTYRAISGYQSMWCGAQPAAGEPWCSYATLPGYGNNWNQTLTSRVWTVQAPVMIDYDYRCDSEPEYDCTYFQYWDGMEWQSLETYSGTNDLMSVVNLAVPTYGANSVRMRFLFQSNGAWSDEDGLWDTQGAFIVDNISVDDAVGNKDTEDWEGEALNATQSTDLDWIGAAGSGYGDYAGLFPGISVLQEDGCTQDLTCLWGFFKGSTDDYSCATPVPQPEQKVIPYENALSQFINNEVWSPWIDLTGGGLVPAGSSSWLDLYVYQDLPLDYLVFYTWHVRSRLGLAGCPSEWRDRGQVYYGDEKSWIHVIREVGDCIEAGNDRLQIALGVMDIYPYWAGIYGFRNCHSHSPLFDHVQLYRIATTGPRFAVRDVDMFQDNFPEDGTLTGTVRIDAAIDMNPPTVPGISPRDEIVFNCSEPSVGLGQAPDGRPAVYCYVRSVGMGEELPNNWEAPEMRGPFKRFQYLGGGPTANGFYQFQCDISFQDAAMTNPVPNQFCFDLNDEYFTPPARIDFYFSAVDANANTVYWTPFTGHTLVQAQAEAKPDEVQCLPTNSGDKILYVDDCDEYGAQQYFESVFELMGIYPDRYDVRAPSSLAGNGLGSRAAPGQIVDVYRNIIWNSGDLSAGTIGDGSGRPEKSPDAQLLFTFLDQSMILNPGLYLSGDNIAQEMLTLRTAPFLNLVFYINMNILLPVIGDHVAYGLPVSPRVIGSTSGSIYDGYIFKHPTFSGWSPDTLIAYGGCPFINDFDVLRRAELSVEAMYYESPGNSAVLTQRRGNGMAKTARVVLSGFSYHYIRDDRVTFPFDRLDHLVHIVRWFENVVEDPTGAGDAPLVTSLTQNYPNPFNPTTTIEFSIKEAARVSLRIYNVAGQLVRTLVDKELTPQDVKPIVWDGLDGKGAPVASGVYFYRLVTKDFSQTRKMVLLK